MVGLPGAWATVRTVVNIRAGGRSRLSGTGHAVVLALLVAVFGNLAAWIPLSSLAGILMVTAMTIFRFLKTPMTA